MPLMNQAIDVRVQTNLDGSRTEYEYFDTSEHTLVPLFRDLFENHFSEFRFGPHVQGSVFEIELSRKPEKISMLDGYLTVDTGAWHFHICIGEHKGTKKNPCPPELSAIRRCAKAALFRILDPEGRPRSWGLDFTNGAGEEMLTIWLPNPWIAPGGGFDLAHPDWSRLALYSELRERLIGERGPESHDATPPNFQH